MGFYSFYRIIKDIIRTIFGNRVFRLVLIACVIGFMLCFVSDKVQATYVSDTNGFFDNTTVLTNNQNSITLNNISVSIPSSLYNNNAFLIKPYIVNGVVTRVYVYYTSGDLKFSFDNNKFYSTDTIYRSYTNVVSNSVDFASFDSTSSYSGSSGANALFSDTDTYDCALYGSLYDNSNNNIIISSSSSTDDIDFPEFPQVYENQNIIVAKNTASTNYYLFLLNDLINSSSHVFYLDTNPAQITFPSGSGKLYYMSVSNGSSWTYYSDLVSSNQTDRYGAYISQIILSSVDIYNSLGTDIVFNANYNTSSTYNPYFEPSDSEIQSLNWDNIYVELGDFDINENDLYIHRLEVSRTVVGTGAEEPISYYYNDNTIKLKKGGKYWRQLFDLDEYYFSIPMSQFDFKPEKAYFLVLTDNSDSITSSLGKVNENYYNNIYQIVEINSGNLITIDDVINNNLEKMGDDVTFLGRTIEESLSIGSESNKELSEETNTNINTNLNFNNQNSGLNNLNNGFFSRLTNLIRSLLNYNLSEDTTINIPYPNSDKNLELHSNIIYTNLSSTFQTLISSFWFFVFGFYMWRFINKIYIAVSTGHILDTFSSSGEAITNDML